MRDRLQQRKDFPTLNVERADIAGLDVAIWRPEQTQVSITSCSFFASVFTESTPDLHT